LNVPATFDQVKQFAADAKLNAGFLLTLNVPYKVETGEGWHTDIVSLRSAGRTNNLELQTTSSSHWWSGMYLLYGSTP